MPENGFTIQNVLASLNVELNFTSLLGGRAQLTEAEVKESQTIASVRIHVERGITRIKKFKALNHIPLTLHVSVNHFVCFVHIMQFLTTFNTENLFLKSNGSKAVKAATGNVMRKVFSNF